MRTSIRPRRPSPAMAVALVALVVALGGTAEATVIITSNADVGPNTISGAFPPSGDAANIIAGSVGGADLHTGSVNAKKLAADALGARAWGYVAAIGTLDSTRSKNINGVTHPGTGEYCVRLPSTIDPSAVSFVVSPDYTTDSTATAERAGVEGGSAPTGSIRCPANALFVTSYNETADSAGLHISAADQPFFILVG